MAPPLPARGEVNPLTQGGQVHEVSFRVTVDDGTEFSTITNTATVDYGAKFIGETFTATTDPVDLDVEPLVDLSISKSDNVDPATAGGTITYTLDVANSGPSTAVNTVIADDLPPGTTLTSLPAGCTLSGSTLTCAVGDLAAGDTASVALTVDVDGATTGTSVTNVATVTSDTHEHDVLNNATSEPTALIREADLRFEKTAPATVQAGTNLTYTLTVENLGQSDALSVTLNDPLPSGTVFVSAAADLGGSCSNAIVCTWPSIPAGSTSTILVEVAVPSGTADGTVIANKAAVTSTDPDPDNTNNTDVAFTEVRSETDLDVTKSGPATGVAGDSISYTVTVGNSGPADAVNTMVTDPVPTTDLIFDATASSTGCSLVGADVVCNAGTLAPLGTASFTIVFAVDPGTANGTVITNVATGSTDTTDVDPSNNSDTVDTTVSRQVDLSVLKDDNTALATAGGQISYTLDYANPGPSDASGVTITDTLPDRRQLRCRSFEPKLFGRRSDGYVYGWRRCCRVYGIADDRR